ncbi:hypothetical protein BD413DRAFT_456572, partial [Trametes elegans]
CGHIYHPECLLQLVDVSMRSPAQYPPRCCRRPIPASLFQPFFSAEQAEAFTAFQKERSTSRRVYCANPRCSLFLGPREKRTPVRIYTCPAPACGTSTCARCRAAVDAATAASPAGHVCTHDAGHRAALQLGSRLGWTRCPECEQLIERSAGCAHMTCACGTQFCYRCGAKWKSCSC